MLCVQQPSQTWVFATLGSLFSTVGSACSTFPSKAESHPVKQYTLHPRDASAQTALPQVAIPHTHLHVEIAPYVVLLYRMDYLRI